MTPSELVDRYMRKRTKCAATWADLTTGLDPKIAERAKDVVLGKRDHDKGARTLKYTVAGKGYVVTIMAVPDAKKDQRHYLESEVEVHCTCPAFRWQGPSYHANKEGYLWDPPISKGKSFVPVVRDPANTHLICKHIYKALESSKLIYFDWEKPRI